MKYSKNKYSQSLTSFQNYFKIILCCSLRNCLSCVTILFRIARASIAMSDREVSADAYYVYEEYSIDFRNIK